MLQQRLSNVSFDNSGSPQSDEQRLIKRLVVTAVGIAVLFAISFL